MCWKLVFENVDLDIAVASFELPFSCQDVVSLGLFYHKLREMLDQDGNLFKILERVLPIISEFYSLLSFAFNRHWKYICANSLMNPWNPPTPPPPRPR